MIQGVELIPLKQIPDERGKVMHMLRCDAPYFSRFGEVYFSQTLPGKVKAWKKHKIMKQHLAVPVGTVKFVIYDDRPESSSKGSIDTIEIGEDNYQLLVIPPMVWYGFCATSSIPALIVNCADLVHDLNEVERLESSDPYFSYQW